VREHDRRALAAAVLEPDALTVDLCERHVFSSLPRPARV
jgi:hypothetical protein